MYHVYRCVCGRVFWYGKWIDPYYYPSCDQHLKDPRNGIIYWLEECGCGMITKLRKTLIRHEGKTNKPYRCTKGHRTIGIGRNMDVKPLPRAIRLFLDEHGYITEEHINALFATDIMDAMSGCIDLYPDFNAFSENRKIALIDFMFNVGYGTARKFKVTNSYINAGNWLAASEEIRQSLYYTQLGGDPPGTDDGKLERPEEIARMLKEG